MQRKTSFAFQLFELGCIKLEQAARRHVAYMKKRGKPLIMLSCRLELTSAAMAAGQVAPLE
jgi:hypothetical protein